MKEFMSVVNSSATPSTDTGLYISQDPETWGGVLGAGYTLLSRDTGGAPRSLGQADSASSLLVVHR